MQNIINRIRRWTASCFAGTDEQFSTVITCRLGISLIILLFLIPVTIITKLAILIPLCMLLVGFYWLSNMIQVKTMRTDKGFKVTGIVTDGKVANIGSKKSPKYINTDITISLANGNNVEIHLSRRKSYTAGDKVAVYAPCASLRQINDNTYQITHYYVLSVLTHGAIPQK